MLLMLPIPKVIKKNVYLRRYAVLVIFFCFVILVAGSTDVRMR